MAPSIGRDVPMVRELWDFQPCPVDLSPLGRHCHHGKPRTPLLPDLLQSPGLYNQAAFTNTFLKATLERTYF